MANKDSRPHWHARTRDVLRRWVGSRRVLRREYNLGWGLHTILLTATLQSLAYEIAPFNLKLTIFQCSIEIGILTNLVTSVPPIVPAYSPASNQAPLFRGMLNRLVPRLPNTHAETNGTQETGQTASVENGPFSRPEVTSMYPPLSSAHMEVLVAETVYAITAIGGHENPPSRHIVGQEGVASVKEKLKTVSEELEDFIQSSYAVDYAAGGDQKRASKDENIFGIGAGNGGV